MAVTAATHQKSMSAAIPSLKQNLTEIEASAEYGMSVFWYRRCRWAGNGPAFIKLGAACLYPRNELEKFFNSRLVKSTSESAVRGN
ncbi:MAG: hypothetical protein WCP20_10070 [Desulfuromonadales bacterium]